MIPLTYAGQTVYLLRPPNWKSSVTTDVEVITRIAQSLSVRETRVPYSASLRWTMGMELFERGQNAQQLQKSIETQTTEPIVSALWPAAVLWADRASMPIIGGLLLAFKEDFSQYELYEDSEPGWVLDTDYVAPVIWGRWTDDPEIVHLTDDMLDISASVLENSDIGYAIAPLASTFADGPQPAGYTQAPKLLEFKPQWANSPSTKMTLAIMRNQIGFGRKELEATYDPRRIRNPQLAFFLRTKAEAASFIRFFMDSRGSGASFWMPSWVSRTRLTADIGAGDSILSVDNTEGVTAGKYLCLVDVDAGLFVPVLVDSVTDTTITLDSPVLISFTADTTNVTALILGRFEQPKLSLEWSTDGLALATVRFMEVLEDVVPSDETIGGTIGLLPTRGYLYEFSRSLHASGFLAFSGANNVSMTGITLGSSVTFCFWAKSAGYDGTAVSINATGGEIVLQFAGGVIKLNSTSFGVSFPDDDWHFFAVILDAVAPLATLYMDGSAVGTCTYVDPSLSSGAVRIGQNHAGAVGFTGSVRDVTLWNSALTQPEVLDLMSSPPIGDESGLKGYWPFDDQVGTVAYDFQVSTKHNGTLNGSPVWNALGEDYVWRYTSYEQDLGGVTVDTDEITVDTDEITVDA